MAIDDALAYVDAVAPASNFVSAVVYVTRSRLKVSVFCLARCVSSVGGLVRILQYLLCPSVRG